MGVREEGVSVFCRRRVRPGRMSTDGERSIRRERVGEIEEAHCPAGTMIYLSKLKALSLLEFEAVYGDTSRCTWCVGFLSPCREESARVQGS